MGSIESPTNYTDVLMVGAGFASFGLLKRLRDLGYGIKLLEKAPASGGIWHWNSYPGARVDSDTPIYQFFDKEIWEDFTYTERYPGGPELQRYFQHVDKKWRISDHVEYNKYVDSAEFDEKTLQWKIECADGTEYTCKFFIPNLGFASKHYSPPVAGLSNFKGDVYHTAKWPAHGVNLKGKRIAQIGCGASGIQCSQTLGPIAKHFTLFQRTPNFCLPMKQHPLDPEEEERKKQDGTYAKAFEDARTTFAGFTYTFADKKTFDDTPEEREKFYDSLFHEGGGFRFWLNNYSDLFADQKANDEAYKYWRAQVLKRVKNPEKQRLLAPEVAPHPWGTKRPSLEQNFYEVADADNFDIIDVNEDPIVEVVENGFKTKSGKLVEFDVLVLATGFDSVTGSLAQLNIRGSDGGTIADHWSPDLKTAIGIGLTNFPNFLYLYGPQAPTAFSNGPSCVQFQSEWVEKFFAAIKKDGITRFEPKQETEDDWAKRTNEVWDDSLFPKAKSWYQASNIPGAKTQPLNWAGGMVAYVEALDKSLENDYQGWNVKKEAAA